MQVQKNQKQYAAATSGIKPDGSANDSHVVFISDDSGIACTFESIKLRLSNGPNSCLTLIYFVSEHPSQSLFKAELDGVGMRFPTQLITYYISDRSLNPLVNAGMNHQILEIVINSNVRKSMQFQIMGEAELAEKIAERLNFLGIHSNKIHLQIF